MLFFGDDHGGEALVGRRDTYWASSGSAITNSLLLSAVWVVRAVFADWNAPALGGILTQQGVGNLTCGKESKIISLAIDCHNIPILSPCSLLSRKNPENAFLVEGEGPIQ